MSGYKLAIFIGLCLALFIILAGKYSRFDRDTSYFPVLLIVIASYYVLFAIMQNQSIVFELMVASCFLFLAVFCAKKAPIVIGIALIMHGLYDILHVFVLKHQVAPHWWGEFCASVDIVLGIWVIYLKRSEQTRSNKHSLSP